MTCSSARPPSSRVRPSTEATAPTSCNSSGDLALGDDVELRVVAGQLQIVHGDGTATVINTEDVIVFLGDGADTVTVLGDLSPSGLQRLTIAIADSGPSVTDIDTVNVELSGECRRGHTDRSHRHAGRGRRPPGQQRSSVGGAADCFDDHDRLGVRRDRERQCGGQRRAGREVARRYGHGVGPEHQDGHHHRRWRCQRRDPRGQQRQQRLQHRRIAGGDRQRTHSEGGERRQR